MLGKRTISEREPHSESKTSVNRAQTGREDGEIGSEEAKVSTTSALSHMLHFNRLDERCGLVDKRIQETRSKR